MDNLKIEAEKEAQVVLNYIEKKRRKYGDKPIRIYLNWQQGGGGSRYIFTRSRLDTPIGDPSFNPKIRRNIKSNFRNWERYGLSSADEITPRMFIKRFKRRFNSIVKMPSKKQTQSRKVIYSPIIAEINAFRFKPDLILSLGSSKIARNEFRATIAGYFALKNPEAMLVASGGRTKNVKKLGKSEASNQNEIFKRMGINRAKSNISLTYNQYIGPEGKTKGRYKVLLVTSTDKHARRAEKDLYDYHKKQGEPFILEIASFPKRNLNNRVFTQSKLEKDIERHIKQTQKVPGKNIPGVADSIASLSTGAGVATIDGEKERSSKGSFLRKFKWFKTKYPQFNFDTFYEKIESLPGGVDKYLPRFEKDYVFGPEHFTAWNKISNMANSSTAVQAQSGSKPTKIKTIVRKTNKDVTACDPKNLEPVPNKSSAGRRYIDAQCANNVYKGPVPGYVGKRSAKWFNLHKAVKQLLWLYCTRNVRVIFGVAGEQHRNVRKAVDFVKKNYGITDLRYEKGTWGSFDRLAEILKSNEPVYIHCTWGVHRSSTVLAGALMINNGLCFDEAIRCADLRFKNFSGGENHKYVKRLKKLQDKLISSGVLSVECKKESLTENKEWKNLLDEMIVADDVKINGLSAKNELNSDIWQNSNQLKEYIDEHLYKIAKNFFVGLELDRKLVKDITITGSIANYNWSSYSDIDLHILVDFSEVDENEKLVKHFFKNATMNWNRNHKITVKDHEVELYVQDSREPHHSTGVYSVKYDKWIKTPSKC